jgi:hypothetical protein
MPLYSYSYEPSGTAVLRTRMAGGVGAGVSDGPRYPIRA